MNYHVGQSRVVGIFYCKYVTIIFLQRALENGNGLFKFSADFFLDICPLKI